jgi:uncharacterized protein YbjT (DUF2867 family)
MKGKILVTGASGFIGTRLVTALQEESYPLRCMVRQLRPAASGGVETVIGDLLEPATLEAAFSGVDTAYYLVHSMAAGRAGFETRDRDAARNFVAAARRAGVRRVIYLGGLGETGDNLSHHLASRIEVARILQEGPFLTTILRAAVIIGADGASFEMVRFLVHRLPLMITPRWVSTRCQPIAVGDVIRYLVGCLTDERTAGKTFDIGGPEILTYREMMERVARVMGRHCTILPIPVLTPKLSSYWVGLMTPVKPSISMPLIEGLSNEVICRDQRIREVLPFPLIPFDDAVRLALAEEKT